MLVCAAAIGDARLGVRRRSSYFAKKKVNKNRELGSERADSAKRGEAVAPVVHLTVGSGTLGYKWSIGVTRRLPHDAFFQVYYISLSIVHARLCI